MRRTLTTTLLATALALSACNGGDPEPGADEPQEAASADGEFPVTVTDAGGEVEITERPDRIVSLSPTHTEILFAVGAGDQVVAVDEHSTYPDEAPTTDLSAFEPNVEAILDEEPDLIVLADAPDLADDLEEVGVDVLEFVAATGLDDAWSQMEAVGQATGHAEAGADLVADLRSEVDEIVEEVPQPDEPLAFYHELDDLHFTVTSETYLGELYGLLGLENIADDADTPYPQLSAEAIIEADPDVIFLAPPGETPETVAERPGWDAITAVEEGSVYPVDADVASRWGPRLVDYLRDVAADVQTTLDRRE